MEQYILKSALVAEIERRIKEIDEIGTYLSPKGVLTNLLCHLDTFEVKDPYEQCIQYDSIKAGIQGHAETYSFNIPSKLFQQLTKEQQVLWRKEIESAFNNGYHQAEKDLSDISWIKEVSGVKDMSRAKEEALKAYPPQSIAANYDTINRRDAFEYGYLKAEKDLELTWEDIKIILDIENDILCECNSKKELVIETYPKGKDYYGEILKRFKERKEK